MSFARKEPRENYTAALAYPKPTRVPGEPKQLRPRRAAPGEAPKFSTLSRGKRMKRNLRTKQQLRETVFAPYERWLTADGAVCAVCGTSENIQGAHVGISGMGMRNGTAADKIRLCGPRIGEIGCHARFDQTVHPWNRTNKAVFSRHQRAVHWRAFRAWTGIEINRLQRLENWIGPGSTILRGVLACDAAIAECLERIGGTT